MEFTYRVFVIMFCGYVAVRGEMTEEMKQMAKVLHEQCVGEAGVDEGVVQNAIKGTIADDPKLKCYMKCLIIQMGAMEEDGTVDFDAFTTVLPEDLQESAGKGLEHCKDKIAGADACEVAYNLNVCLQKFDPARYMLI